MVGMVRYLFQHYVTNVVESSAFDRTFGPVWILKEAIFRPAARIESKSLLRYYLVVNILVGFLTSWLSRD